MTSPLILASASPRRLASLAKFGIKGYPQTPVEELSGGNQQRLLLSFLPPDPRLLLLENPTRGLDVGATESVQKTLLEQRAKGAGVLLVSEDLDELLTICDRIAVMYEGRVMGILPAEAANRDEMGLMMAGEAGG